MNIVAKTSTGKTFLAPSVIAIFPAGSPCPPQQIVLVGTYKERQLKWIKENGVYNYPVKEGDAFDAEAFGKIKELWLCADAQGCRHCFSAEFIGKMSRDEFLAAYPTYGERVKSRGKCVLACEWGNRFKVTVCDLEHRVAQLHGYRRCG